MKMGKVVSVLIGAVSGFVAGILLAPKSGKETREELKQKAQSVKDKSVDSYDRVSTEVKEGGRRLKTLAEDSLDNLKSNAKEAKAEVSRRGNSVKDEADRTKRSVERDIK